MSFFPISFLCISKFSVLCNSMVHKYGGNNIFIGLTTIFHRSYSVENHLDKSCRVNFSFCFNERVRIFGLDLFSRKTSRLCFTPFVRFSSASASKKHLRWPNQCPDFTDGLFTNWHPPLPVSSNFRCAMMRCLNDNYISALISFPFVIL